MRVVLVFCVWWDPIRALVICVWSLKLVNHFGVGRPSLGKRQTTPEHETNQIHLPAALLILACK